MEAIRVFLWVVILLVQQAVIVFTRDSYKLVSGLQLERIPSPSSHFYKEYVPLVFQFTIPRWKKTNTVIYGSQNCNSTNYTKFFTTCPVLFHLNELQERFSEYLDNSQPLVVNLEDIGAKPESALVSFDCELISPHFEDIFMDQESLDDYLARLKSCSPLGSNEYIRGITSYVYNITSIYLEMRRNFYSEYWLKIDLIDGRVDAAIWTNAVNTLNSLIFQNYMMEANRWKMAVMDCEAGKIPSSLLPPSLLGDTLTDMLESLTLQQLTPTVSTDTVGNYYKASLTDCTFTKDTFLVRILIPVIPKKEKFLLMKVAPLPFYFRDTRTQSDWQCQIDPKVLPATTGESDETYVIVDLVKNVAYESDCKPGKLCHIPSAQHPRKVSSCVTAAYNWDRFVGKNGTATNQDLLKHCPIKCQPVNAFKKDLLKHVGHFEFFWFNGASHENRSITVNCTAKTGVQVYKYANVSFGSQMFDLACHCKLTYQSQVYTPKPCNGWQQSSHAQDSKSWIQQSHLAPVQWYSDELIKGSRIAQLWDVPKSFFENPSPSLIKQSLKGSTQQDKMAFADKLSYSAPSNFLVNFLTFMCFGLVIMVGAIGWKLYTLLGQLQRLGLNVKGQGSWVHKENDDDQQVSYRNMVSSADTDNSLLINDSH